MIAKRASLLHACSHTSTSLAFSVETLIIVWALSRAHRQPSRDRAIEYTASQPSTTTLLLLLYLAILAKSLLRVVTKPPLKSLTARSDKDQDHDENHSRHLSPTVDEWKVFRFDHRLPGRRIQGPSHGGLFSVCDDRRSV